MRRIEDVADRRGMPKPALRLPLVTAALAALALAGSASAAVTPFTARYTSNTTGDVSIAGNTVLTCPPAAGGCTGVLAGGVGRNNDYAMTYVDIDGDPATFDSSSADVSLPSGAQVLFAGLYWGGRSGAGGGGGAAAPNAGARTTVKLKAPGAGAYTSVTGSETGDVGDAANAYQAFADVTAQVTAAGNGTYTVADVQAATGTDAYGGWSLVVAYRDAASPLRNLAVFDGFEVVSSPSNTSKTITVTGLFAPPAGAVKAKVGVIALDGDRGQTGDTLTLNGTAVSDALHPANDMFNSSFADRGTRFTAKSPDYANSLGMDASIFAADGLVANGATSATIDLTTGGETYYPGVVTSVIDLYAPKLVVQKSATDVDGGSLLPGDVLEYAVSVTNEGTESASAVILTDALPAGTTPVAGSLRITAGDGAGALTDAAGDDRGEISGGTVTARLGGGATAGAGGSLAAGATTTATFRATVGASVAAGTSLANTASVAHTAATAGIALVATSNPVTSVVAAPPAVVTEKGRLAISIAGPRRLTAGATGRYTIVVRSLGPATATGVRLRIPIPEGLAVRSLPKGFRVTGGLIIGPAMNLPKGARRTIVLGLAAASSQRRSVALTASASGAKVAQVRAQTPVRVQPVTRVDPPVTG